MCKNGPRIVVAYIFRGERRHYFACASCDLVSRWPNYERTAPAPKE